MYHHVATLNELYVFYESSSSPASPRTLKRVAEKLAECGDAGLAPLADTRRDPRQQPVRLDFDLKLADIRSEAERRVSAANTS